MNSRWKNARKKHAIFVRHYKCRRTKLHEIASQSMHFVRVGTKTRSRRGRRSASRRGTTRSANGSQFSSAFYPSKDGRRKISEGGRALDFQKEMTFCQRQNDGGALKNATSRKNTSLWGAFFINVTFSIVRGRRGIRRISTKVQFRTTFVNWITAWACTSRGSTIKCLLQFY